ncbi:MAG: hypothetical protein MJ135_02885 [Oscillospiraceae bacterium]|nr:hypothetical protein [Oscillospiraceae bacterium]
MKLKTMGNDHCLTLHVTAADGMEGHFQLLFEEDTVEISEEHAYKDADTRLYILRQPGETFSDVLARYSTAAVFRDVVSFSVDGENNYYNRNYPHPMRELSVDMLRSDDSPKDAVGLIRVSRKTLGTKAGKKR